MDQWRLQSQERQLSGVNRADEPKADAENY